MSTEQRLRAAIRDVQDFPKPGILFKDITPVLEDQSLCSAIVDAFIGKMNGERPDAIVGIESRGFLFGFLLANKLNIPFVLIRKAGKLPYQTVSHEYDLEYGTSKVEMHVGSIHPGWKVMIHDDLLATGGTAAAAATLIEQQGASVSAFSFLISLDFLNGKEKLLPHSKNIQCLTHY